MTSILIFFRNEQLYFSFHQDLVLWLAVLLKLYLDSFRLQIQQSLYYDLFDEYCGNLMIIRPNDIAIESLNDQDYQQP